MPSNSQALAVAGTREAPRAVRAWLIGIVALLAAMILVGGATRLTESGLSITEWKPVLGAIPPLSHADWEAAFEAYKRIPQYMHLNAGMSLDEFKSIYWWEWTHRFLGRFIGIAFLLPLIGFWLAGAIPQRLKPHLVVLFALGGLQGVIGWYMVMSGLADRVSVSQYRLALHLGFAVVILGYALWLVLDLSRSSASSSGQVTAPRVMWTAWGVLGLIYLQMLLGALVAGLDAGMGYNTWPLMDGALVPSGLGAMSPWYLNLFENALTVQFNHRMLGYGVFLAIFAQAIWLHGRARELQRSAWVLVTLASLQVGLGIWVLLAQVPIALGLAHQAGAVLLFMTAVWHLHRAVGMRSPRHTFASA